MSSSTKESRNLVLGLGGIFAVLLAGIALSNWTPWGEGGGRAALLVLLIAMGAMNAVLLHRLLRAGRLRIPSSESDTLNARHDVAIAESRFRDAIESMAEAVLFWDASGRLTFWNQRCLDMIPQSFPLLRPGLDFETYLREIAARLSPNASSETTAQWIAEWQRRRAQPGQSWAFVASTGRHLEFVEQPTSDGGLISIYRDVTEYVAASQRAEDAEAMLRDGIDSMDDGFLLLDRGDRLVLWNARYAELMPHAAPLLRVGGDWLEAIEAALIRRLPHLDVEERRLWIADRLAARSRGESVEFEADGRIIRVIDRRTGDGGHVIIVSDVTQDKRLVERLIQSEMRFRDGIESMADGLAQWDRDGRLITTNQRYLDLMPHLRGIAEPGLAMLEFAQRAARAAFPHFSDDECFDWAVARERNARSASPTPINFTLAGGRIIELVDRPTSEGGVITLARDITDARRAAARIEESEERLRDGLDAMSEGVAIWDDDDRLIMWNRRYLELVPHTAPFLRAGMSLRQIIEETVLIRNPDWSPEARAADVEKRLRLRHMFGQPRPIVTPSGRILEFVDHAMSSGGFITTIRDVTGASRAADQLAASEALFRDGLESMGDGVLIYNAQGQIETWNSRYLEMYPEARDVLRRGVTCEEFIRGVFERIYPMNTTAQTDALTTERLHRMTNLDKPCLRRIYAGRIYEVDDRRTSAGGILTVHRDITSLVQSHEVAERALESEREMNTRQRRFISIASHEFRTPLAIIDGARQRIAAHLTDRDPEIVKRLDRIRDAVLRMTGIIERILSSGRLDEGRIEMSPRSVNLSEMLRELCDRQRQINPQFAINLSMPERLAPIEADPDLLDQVFTNLLSNAVKYSGAGRQIDVTVTESEIITRIAVRDHGIGVAADEIPSLFTRYFRARSAQGIPGTGIGLHFVRELVAMHGGRIDVASELGKGSTFLVDLPRVIQTGVAPAEDAAA